MTTTTAAIATRTGALNDAVVPRAERDTRLSERELAGRDAMPPHHGRRMQRMHVFIRRIAEMHSCGIV